MIPLEVRFEDVSGKTSIIVTANLVDSWRPIGNHFGFYAFAHENYLENGLITVRVWVIESPAKSIRAQDSFPLDLQSMGSSPSRAMVFRLFNGRLSVAAALSTVINSRRSDGSPGYYKEAVLLAQHAGVSYWLRFYAALNDEHPEMPEWTEQDFPPAEEGTLPRVTDIRDLRASNLEDRLSRVSMALDSLEERARALVGDFQARPDSGPAALQANGANLAEDSEKTGHDLTEQWSKQLEKQAEAALDKLREEAANSGRVFEEHRQQLASLAEAKLASLNQAAANAVASLEAAVEKLREEISDSGRALAAHREKLASLAEAKLASVNQAAANAVASLEAAVEKLREEVGNAGRAIAENKQQLAGLAEQRRTRSHYASSRPELAELFAQRSAEQPSTFVDYGAPSNRKGVVVMLTLAAGLFLVVTVPPWGKFLSTPPPPVQMHLQAEVPPDFADQSPYWSAKRRAKEEETAQAYWRAAASSLQMRYPYGSQLPADPPPEFQVDTQYAPAGAAGAVKETRAHYWDKLRAYWGQRRFWIGSQPAPETWAVRLRRVWEQFKAKFV